MNIINARSPYIIQIAGTGSGTASQTESKVELFIWAPDSVEPGTASYVLSNKAASPTQTTNVYDISPYIREYISIAHFGVDDAELLWEDTYNNFCFVRVKRYTKTISTSFTLLTNTLYTALNSYTNYMQNTNATTNNNGISTQVYTYGADELRPLWNVRVPTQVDGNSMIGTGFFPLLYTKGSTASFEVRFMNGSTSLVNWYLNDITGATGSGTYMIDIPWPIDYTGFDEKVWDMKVYRDGVYVSGWTFGTFQKLHECKYTPATVSYINRFGGVEFLTFFKAREDNFSVKSTEYNILPQYYSNGSVYYNTSVGQTREFNFIGTKSMKVNTGWVSEVFREKIKDLMLSESIVLYEFYNGTYPYYGPVILKTKSIKLQNSITDKLINYNMEFEYSFNNINDVI